MAWPSASARTKNWGTEILTDTDLESELDLLHSYINDMMNSSTGHKHDGTTSEGPKIATGGIANDAVTFDQIDDDGNFGPFTGDWQFNEIAFPEGTAPSTAASEMKIYTKDTSGQPELFVREESDGDEIQITSGGSLNVNTNSLIKAWVNFTGTSTVTINDHYNVSSITDNGTGDYTVNYTTAFGSINYAFVATARADSDTTPLYTSTKAAHTTSASRFICVRGTNESAFDSATVNCIAIGDQ